jgi:predicted Ser/Thr protein kinase
LAIEPGTIVAKRYRVTDELGKGGMGEVFAAENTRTGRMVALKVLRAESKQKQSAIERFRREARAAGSINSDFVTQVLDVEDDAEHGIVLVFELLEGESLVERLKRTGPVPYAELWGIVEAVWIGLADAHAAGIIHRDLKPSNVFLEQRRGSRRVKILDFGISKLPKKISTQSLTQVGQSLGTFSFMPPEQIGKAKSVDHRADIYACTTLIYQAMSGKLPYHAKNVVAMMELKNKTEPRTLGEVMKTPIDPRLEAFISRGLSRNPDARFQTALGALSAWRALRPTGATSVTDLEASGVYPQAHDAPPSSGELQTRVINTRAMGAPIVRDNMPATVRDAPAAQAYHAAQADLGQPHAPHPAQHMPPPPAAHAPSAEQQEVATLVSPHGQMAAMVVEARKQALNSQPPQQMHDAAEGPAASMAPSGYPMPPAHPAGLPAKNGLRTFLALFFGAIALMAVGFVTVALVLHLLG